MHPRKQMHELSDSGKFMALTVKAGIPRQAQIYFERRKLLMKVGT
jgi:hypothetical protein